MTARTRALGSIVLVLVFAARECGAIDFQFETSRSTTTHTAEINGKDKLAKANIRMEYVDGDQLHLRSISQASGEPIAVTARVASFEIRGCTWLPLVKWAHVEFGVDITTSDPEVSGSIQGTIEKNSRGSMSSRAFRASLHDEARERVLDSLLP